MIEDFCWYCLRNKARRAIRHPVRRYIRWLRYSELAILWNALLIVAGLLLVVTEIVSLFIPGGWSAG